MEQIILKNTGVNGLGKLESESGLDLTSKSPTMAASPPPIATVDHPRLLLHGFLSPETCKELEFVHRSCGTAGYRPSVVSTSLPHLAATGCGHLLLPFVPIREQLRDAVESFFSCHFDLFVEFTGLISWCKGASIGWHSDDNKPYLRQRVFTVRTKLGLGIQLVSLVSLPLYMSSFLFSYSDITQRLVLNRHVGEMFKFLIV